MYDNVIVGHGPIIIVQAYNKLMYITCRAPGLRPYSRSALAGSAQRRLGDEVAGALYRDL